MVAIFAYRKAINEQTATLWFGIIAVGYLLVWGYYAILTLPVKIS